MGILEFRKQCRSTGTERGYYFEGEFLSKYKNEAISMLRLRIEEKGREIGDMSRSAWDKGKEALPNVWQAIHYEWAKSREKVRKTNEKIKDLREGKRADKIPYRIAMLEEEIVIEKMKMNEKINDIKEFYGKRIKQKQDIIQELKEENEKI